MICLWRCALEWCREWKIWFFRVIVGGRFGIGGVCFA